VICELSVAKTTTVPGIPSPGTYPLTAAHILSLVEHPKHPLTKTQPTQGKIRGKGIFVAATLILGYIIVVAATHYSA
jgi:hypothetical protein